MYLLKLFDKKILMMHSNKKKQESATVNEKKDTQYNEQWKQIKTPTMITKAPHRKLMINSMTPANNRGWTQQLSARLSSEG